MEIRLFTRDELWNLLEKEGQLYTRYAIVSDKQIQCSLPGVKVKDLDMMWLLESENVSRYISIYCICNILQEYTQYCVVFMVDNRYI